MLDPNQRRLLGDFVRAHRERVAPEAPTGRRRTPGMRGEELAAKAGMSATWCAWIEQGREVQASPEARPVGARPSPLARRARLPVRTVRPARSGTGGFGPDARRPGVAASDRRGARGSGLRTGSAVERLLLEPGRGTIVRGLARRRASAQSAALRLPRSSRAKVDP